MCDAGCRLSLAQSICAVLLEIDPANSSAQLLHRDTFAPQLLPRRRALSAEFGCRAVEGEAGWRAEAPPMQAKVRASPPPPPLCCLSSPAAAASAHNDRRSLRPHRRLALRCLPRDCCPLPPLQTSHRSRRPAPCSAKAVSNGKSGSGFLVAGGEGVAPSEAGSYSVLLKQLHPPEAALLPPLLPAPMPARALASPAQAPYVRLPGVLRRR